MKEVLPKTSTTDRFISQQVTASMPILNPFQMKSVEVICKLESTMNKEFERDRE
jgi:hypothetical protein